VELLSEAREGIPLNKQEFYDLDETITTGLQQGQHIYHIVETNNIETSLSSIYHYFEKGYFTASVMELPRVVKFKPRKKEHSVYVPRGAKIGREYRDFLIFIDENGILSWIEMDTVIGHTGGKIIIALCFNYCLLVYQQVTNPASS